VNKIAESFSEYIKKLAWRKPSPWDLRAVPQDDRARMPAYYTGPGTMGAVEGLSGVRKPNRVSTGWMDSLRKKIGG
jgi:hypothetical protein